jgi:hypothetical protein
MTGPILATWLIIILHILFIAYLWKPELRFSLKLLPLLIALGCATVSHALEATIRILHALVLATRAKIQNGRTTHPWNHHVKHFLPHLPTTLTLLLALTAILLTNTIHAQQSAYLTHAGAGKTFPFYGNKSRHIEMGRWIGKKLPTATFMCRNPWETLFYASPQNKAIALPYPEDTGTRGAEEIFAIARYYKVTHFYHDLSRPSLFPYMNGTKPGMKRIYGAPSPIYELDWDLLPKKTVHDLWPEK